MNLNLLRMRRNVYRNVFNDRKNISATTYYISRPTTSCIIFVDLRRHVLYLSTYDVTYYISLVLTSGSRYHRRGVVVRRSGAAFDHVMSGVNLRCCCDTLESVT